MTKPFMHLRLKKKWIPGLAVAFVLLIVAYVGWRGLRSLVIGAPVRSVMHTVESPNRRFVAYAVAVAQGGATVGYSYEVIVLPLREPLLLDRNHPWIWHSYRMPPTTISWRGDSEIHVRVERANFDRYRELLRTRRQGDFRVLTDPL